MGKTLAEHAAYELTKAGLANSDEAEARSVATKTMALIRRFEKQKNTEREKDFILEALNRLLNFIPLTPISDDPDEWDKFDIQRKNVDTGEIETKTVWQSRRGTSMFSEDGGKTFVDQATGKTGSSLDHVAEAQRIEDEKKAAEERKANAAARTEQPIGHVNPDVPADEAVMYAPTAPGEDDEKSNSVDKSAEDANKTETK